MKACCCSHPRIGYVVAYGAAALVATVRGNDAWTRVSNRRHSKVWTNHGAARPRRTGPGAPDRRQTRHSRIVTFHFLPEGETHGSFRRNHRLSGCSRAANNTVFIQLTFSGSFTTGGDPLNLATLSNPNGLDVEGLFELRSPWPRPSISRTSAECMSNLS